MNYLLREQVIRNKNKQQNRPHFIQKDWNHEDNLIFLSASHASRHLRDGVVKSVFGEVISAIVAEDIQNILNHKYQKAVVGIIYKTNNPYDDPNYVPDSEYRKEVIQSLQKRNGLLIDFHNMSNNYGADVEIGTNFYKNVKGDEALIAKFREQFEKRQFRVTVDERFPAHKDLNFSKEVSRHCKGIKSIQIECNFDVYYKTSTYMDFILSLVKSIDQYIQENSPRL